MSFWSKKTDEQATASQLVATATTEIRETINQLEIRISTMENSSNKREKMSFQEIKTRVDEIAESIDTRFKSIEERIQSVETKPTPFTELIGQQEQHHVKILKLTEVQKTLEERITSYDEKLLNLQELTDRFESQLQAFEAKLEAKPKSSNTGFQKTSVIPVIGSTVPSVAKPPSWVKAKPKLDIETPISDTPTDT
jgi:DNA repair ATPase RecN